MQLSLISNYIILQHYFLSYILLLILIKKKVLVFFKSAYMHRSTYRCVYVSIRRHKKPKTILHVCIYAFIYMHIRTDIYRLLLHQKEFLLVSKHLHEIQYIHFALLNWCCYIK